MVTRALIVVLLITGCSSQPEKKEDRFEYDQQKGILKINDAQNLDLKKIELSGNDQYKQSILLDSNQHIREVLNILPSPSKKRYINTWVGFDYQGNYIEVESYIYQTYLSEEGDVLYMNCLLPNLLFDESECFVVAGKFDDRFNLKSHPDTIKFSKEYIAKIPIKDPKVGANNMKFIIIEETHEGKVRKQKITYVNKDFFIQASN